MKFNFSLFWEKKYPYILTAVISLTIYFLRSNNYVQILKNHLLSESFISSLLATYSIIFGFLLTVLTLAVSSSSKGFSLLYESGRLSEYISYNKQAVKTIFVSIIISLFILPITENTLNPCICKMALYFWGIMNLLSFILTYRFLDIFYALAKR